MWVLSNFVYCACMCILQNMTIWYSMCTSSSIYRPLTSRLTCKLHLFSHKTYSDTLATLWPQFIYRHPNSLLALLAACHWKALLLPKMTSFDIKCPFPPLAITLVYQCSLATHPVLGFQNELQMWQGVRSPASRPAR